MTSFQMSCVNNNNKGVNIEFEPEKFNISCDQKMFVLDFG